MKKRHKRVRNGVVALTAVMMVGLFVCGQRVKVLTKDIEYQIRAEQEAVNEKNNKLIDMQKQLEEMDSLDYVKKVASEDLGMVESDTIVFKAKE